MLILFSDVDNEDFVGGFYEEVRVYVVVEWNFILKFWEEMGIQIFFKVCCKYYSVVGIFVVVEGNELVIFGCVDDESFKIVVYKRVENYW